jgi:zinc protease
MRLHVLVKGVGIAIAVSLVARPTVAQSDGHPDRPVPGPVPSLHFPKVQERRLSNGVRVIVLEDHSLPIVTVRLVLDMPDAFDPPGKEGLGGIAGAMMGEGTVTRSAEQLAVATAQLGNHVSPFGFTTVAGNVERSFDLMADQLLHPAFPQASLDRIKANAIAGVQHSRQSSDYMASRVFETTVYGPTHPYAAEETEASIASITRDDVIARHRAYDRPRNATFLVAGDLSADAAVAALSHAFAGWPSGGEPGRRPVRLPAGPGPTRVYLVDRPGAAQSTILVGGLGPRRDTPDYYAVKLMSTTLGEAFDSRLNLDLREAHGWTYGAHGGFEFRVVPEMGTFTATTDVATPKTDSAVTAMAADIAEIRTTRPVTDTELAFAKRTMTLSLPLELETIEQMAGATAGLIEQHLPFDYYDHLVARLMSVTTADAQAAAERQLDPAHLAIVVVGDRAKIEAGLRASHVAPVVVVTVDSATVPRRGKT